MPLSIYQYLLLFVANVLTCFLAASAFSQPLPDSVSIEVFLESYLEGLDDEQEIDEELLAEIQHLFANRIDFNRADVASLERIPFLGPQEAGLLIVYRDSLGSVTNFSELLLIKGVDREILLGLQPFLLFRSKDHRAKSNSSQWSRLQPSLTLAQRFSRQFDLPVGFKRPKAEGGFHGSPAGLYTRFAAELNANLYTRIVLEKDPGESLSLWPNASGYGIDHITGAVALKNLRFIHTAIAGDFLVQFGQGLLIWPGTGRGKGTQPLKDPVRKREGFKPAASSEENNFFRGFAVSLCPLSRFCLSAFNSNRTLDASLTPSDSTGELLLNALSTSGLHRNDAEQARKDALTERTQGAAISYQTPIFKLGTAAIHSRLNHFPILSSQPTSKYSNKEPLFQGGSIYASLNYRQFQGSAEIARSMTGANAIAAYALVQLHERAKYLLHIRHFDSRYTNRFANAFSDQRARVQNESGIYMALSLRPHAIWSSSVFLDFYQHPWLKTNIYRPTKGYELFARVAYHPRPWTQVRMQLRFEEQTKGSQAATQAGRLVRSIEKVNRLSVQTQLDYEFSRSLRFKTRIEMKRYHHADASEWGALLFQDIALSHNNMLLYFRLSVFNANSGQTTLYAYERDVRYRFSIISLTGTGTRSFVFFRAQIGTHLSLEVKYGTTRFERHTLRGAGVDLRSGTLVRSLRTQVILQI